MAQNVFGYYEMTELSFQYRYVCPNIATFWLILWTKYKNNFWWIQSSKQIRQNVEESKLWEVNNTRRALLLLKPFLLEGTSKRASWEKDWPPGCGTNSPVPGRVRDEGNQTGGNEEDKSAGSWGCTPASPMTTHKLFYNNLADFKLTIKK